MHLARQLDTGKWHGRPAQHGLKINHKTVHGFFLNGVVSRDKLPLGWAEPEQPPRPPPVIRQLAEADQLSCLQVDRAAKILGLNV